jgi:hypothetical protein
MSDIGHEDAAVEAAEAAAAEAAAAATAAVISAAYVDAGSINKWSKNGFGNPVEKQSGKFSKDESELVRKAVEDYCVAKQVSSTLRFRSLVLDCTVLCTGSK